MVQGYYTLQEAAQYLHVSVDELKQLAQRLVAVLKPIIDTIDRYGLKRRHLHKHERDAEGFFRYLEGSDFTSGPARSAPVSRSTARVTTRMPS